MLTSGEMLGQQARSLEPTVPSLRSRIDETDPDSKSSRRLVNDMKELAERLPDLLGAINDVVMKRGFDEIVGDNFAEVFARLPKRRMRSDDSATDGAVHPASTLRDLANGLGKVMASQLETACLAMDSYSVADLFRQATQWFDAGGEHATPEIRKRILLCLTNAVLHDEGEGRIRDHDLADAARFLERANLERATTDTELDALAVALRLHIEQRAVKMPVPLDELTKIDHPIALANRIRLLVNRGDVDGAFDLVHHNPLHERWAELAVVVYARLRRFSDADAICEMMRTNHGQKADPVVSTLRYHRCLLAYADELYGIAREDRHTSEGVYPGRLSAGKTKKLREVLDVLDPLISRVLGAGRLLNGIERRAAELALSVTHLLLDHGLATRISQALVSTHPISRQVTDAIGWGYLKPDPDLLVRLARDWPDDLNVSISIAEVQVSSFGENEDALNRIRRMSRLDLTQQQRDRIVRIAFQISANASGGIRNQAFGLLAELAGPDHQFVRMAEAQWALDEREFERAEGLLNERPAPDDPSWLSMHAAALEQQGRLNECLSDLKDLSVRTGVPEAFWRVVDMALRVGDIDCAISHLEQLIAFPTERRRAQHALAECLYQTNEHDRILRAAGLYEKLYNESPDEIELACNAAVCLRDVREIDRAVGLLQDVITTHPGCLKAVLIRADILQASDRADEAFEVLNRGRHRFWGETDFLLRYMDLGYRTDHELDAHRAMMQIRELEEGKDEPEKTVRALNLDDIIQFARNRREFIAQCDDAVVRGRLPWTLLPFQAFVPMYRAWSYRTQPVTPWETPAGRASFATYTTNAFYVAALADGSRQVEPIEAPDRGTEIVADISALITLHKLGLLETVAKFFRRIFLPAIYRELEFVDAQRLQPHQRSQVDQASRLHELLIRGELRRCDDSAGAAITIDFGLDNDAPGFTVGDVLDWMYDSGHISKDERDSSARLHQLKASGRSGCGESLRSRQARFTANAIQVLDSASLLDRLLSVERVLLTAEAAREIEQTHFFYNQQTRMAGECRGFWQAVRDNESIVFACDDTLPDDGANEDAPDGEERQAADLALASCDLAGTRRLPLLADDRCLHVTAQNRGDPALASIAFSTAELLPVLEASGMMDRGQLLQHQRRLMEWRYRYVLVDEKTLLNAAKSYRSKESVVGAPLRQIAEYVQDCMVDVGLFGGEEPVEPPRSMALELYRYWTRTCACFVNALWTGSAFSDQEAENITRWAIDSLLPTIPITARPDIQINLAHRQPSIFLVYLLSQRGLSPDTARSAGLMAVLKDSLGMDEGEFFRNVFTLVELDADRDDADEISAEEWQKINEIHRRGIARHALAQYQKESGGYEVNARGAVLLEASKSLRKRVPTESAPREILDILENPEHNLLPKEIPPGPLVFHLEPSGNQGHVFEVTDLLMQPNAETRAAVCAFFRHLTDRLEPVASDRTKSAFQALARKVVQKRVGNWYPAAEDLLAVLENDWQLNAAGFRQALAARNDHWIRQYWLRCIRPKIHPANSTPTAAFHACTDCDTLEKRVLNSIRSKGGAAGVIDAYCRELGHLPLGGHWDLFSILECVVPGSESSGFHRQLLELAGHEHYLHAYHGCAALVGCWDSLSVASQNEASQRISDFVVLSLNDDFETLKGRFWACLRRLAKHYLDLIPLYGPELGKDNSASLAWWLAERMTVILLANVESQSDPTKPFAFVLDRMIDPLRICSFSANQLIRGGTTGSAFHMNTQLDNGGPFLVSLMATMGDRFGTFYSRMHQRGKEHINEWLVKNGIFRPTGLAQTGSVLFVDYAHKMDCVLASWQREIGANADMTNAFAQSQSAAESLADPNAVEELLTTFPDRDATDRLVWLVRLRISAWHRTLALDPILRSLRNRESRRRFVQALTLNDVSQAIELLLAIQQYAGEPWFHETPQLLVDWLDHVQSVEQKALILNGVVCAAVAGNSPSALRRVRERDDLADLAESLLFQSERISSFRDMVPRWTWARLRVFLSLLT
jgi:tetratricopeptide (TPR) repeat protein